MKILLIPCIVAFALQSSGYSQSEDDTSIPNDISIFWGFGHNIHFSQPHWRFPGNRSGIQFRKPMNEKLRLSFSYSSEYRSPTSLTIDGYIYQDDTMRIKRSESVWGKNYALSAGVDYNINEYLFVSSDILIGYIPGTVMLEDAGETKYNTPDGEEWVNSYVSYEYHGYSRPVANPSASPTFKYREIIGRNQYISFGGEASIGGQLDLWERWQVALQYTAQFMRFEYLGSDINYDGPGETSDDFSSFNDYRQYLDVFVRFKI